MIIKYSIFYLTLLFIALFVPNVAAQNRQEWDAGTYPNPTSDGYRRCNMRSPAFLCDPDAVLTESERYRLNYELNQLETKTRQPHGDNFCSKKGVVTAIAIAKHVRGGSENAVKAMANDMLKRWTLDKQCSKSLVIVVATEDRKFWVARDYKVPVYAAEFTDLFNEQKQQFKEGNYQQALTNILDGTREKALAKQGTAAGGDGSSRGTPFQPSPRDRSGGKGGGGGGFSLPKIPAWIWLALILVVIPLLCCCCCLYFCCCRGKSEGGGRPMSSDEDPEHAGPGSPKRGSGGGGLGGGLRNFASGMGGAAVMNMITNCIRSRGSGGGAGGGGGGGYRSGGGGGDYQPGQPRIGGGQAGGGGRGLYPSAEVKDEGGGGNW